MPMFNVEWSGVIAADSQEKADAAAAEYGIAEGSADFAAVLERDDIGVARIRGRQPQPILPAHQASGLQQRRGPQGVLTEQKARAKADAVAGEEAGPVPVDLGAADRHGHASVAVAVGSHTTDS